MPHKTFQIRNVVHDEYGLAWYLQTCSKLHAPWREGVYVCFWINKKNSLWNCRNSLSASNSSWHNGVLLLTTAVFFTQLSTPFSLLHSCHSIKRTGFFLSQIWPCKGGLRNQVGNTCLQNKYTHTIPRINHITENLHTQCRVRTQ